MFSIDRNRRQIKSAVQVSGCLCGAGNNIHTNIFWLPMRSASSREFDAQLTLGNRNTRMFRRMLLVSSLVSNRD